MAISLHIVQNTLKDLGKSHSLYRTLGLAIPLGQYNKYHCEFIAKNGYSIGFIPVTTLLQTDPTWKALVGKNRVSL